jgi:indole-3-glycerol phosphate synthase
MSQDFLTGMARASHERVQSARSGCSLPQIRALALSNPPPIPLRLSAAGFDLIAEVKLRSPAAGLLEQRDAALDARVALYARAGAAAVSILTEPTRFDGSLEHLRAGAAALSGLVPAMRKDFLVDPYQVWEARAAGAGGILVILRMLEPEAIGALLDAAVECGLFVLLEAFDEADLHHAGELVDAYGAKAVLLVGVNCRDLATLQVVPGRLETLAASLPAGVPGVAESGLETAADAARLARAGFAAALVGSALMRAADPHALARSMLEAGRAARRAARG